MLNIFPVHKGKILDATCNPASPLCTVKVLKIQEEKLAEI